MTTKILFFIYIGFLTIQCSSAPKANLDERKIVVESGDVVIDGANLQIPFTISCIEGFKTVTVQVGDETKMLDCDTNGKVAYVHLFPKEKMKENREKKKDYVFRGRIFHPEDKKKTLTQSLVIVSHRDFQAKLEINQTMTTMNNMDGVFSDVYAHGQCAEGSTMEIEIFDDARGVSLEEETLACSETGFSFSSRRPGGVKKGMRLLIRQIKNDKALSSYEVVLFN
jgi:hypothetical protein